MGSGASKSNSTSALEETHFPALSRQNLNEHVHNLLNGLVSLQHQATFCDFYLCVKETEKGPAHKIPAHKCVLAAASEYFRELFGVSSKTYARDSPASATTSTANGHNTSADLSSASELTLDFIIPKAAVEATVHFLYSAMLDVTPQLVFNVLEAAVKLKISALTKRCAGEIQKSFQWRDLQKALRVSAKLNLPDLREFVLRRSIENFDEFAESQEFVMMDENELQEILDYRKKILDTSIVSELQMFNAILKWHKQAAKERRPAGQRLLKCLNYGKIPHSTLLGYILVQDIVSNDSELRTKVEDVLGLDKKRVLQRLRNRGPNRNLDNNGDVTRSLRPSVVIVGGRLFDQFNSQIHSLSLKEESWVEVTRLPTTLAYHAVAAVDNALYVCGGEDSAIAGVRGLMSLWSFDPSENQWESLADMQQGRSSFYLGATTTHLFAVGGKSSKTPRASVEKYNISNRRWEFAPSLKLPRYAHAGCFYKHVFYVSGGVTKTNSSSDMLKFDPVHNHWDVAVSMKAARSNHVMATVRDRIFVIGGEVESQGVCDPVPIAIECYMPQCDQWHTVGQKTTFQGARECACAVLNGLVYLVGGCRMNVTDYRHEVACYDPEKDEFEVSFKLPRRMRGNACAVLEL